MRKYRAAVLAQLLILAAVGLAGHQVVHAQAPQGAQTAQAAPNQAVANRNLAPGFTHRPAGSKLAVIPADLELYTMSAGGVIEPRADWTEAAQTFLAQSLNNRRSLLGQRTQDLTEKDLDDLAQIHALHGAVAGAVVIHHMHGFKLPTKDGKLDWTLGEDAVKGLKEKTGADYALFFKIRDSYASAERKAAIVVMAVLGVAIAGGAQIGYASLVDLNTGQVVWFNNLWRPGGDLREAKGADETLDTLLRSFPSVR